MNRQGRWAKVEVAMQRKCTCYINRQGNTQDSHEFSSSSVVVVRSSQHDGKRQWSCFLLWRFCHSDHKPQVAVGTKQRKEMVAVQAGWYLEGCGGTEVCWDLALEWSTESFLSPFLPLLHRQLDCLLSFWRPSLSPAGSIFPWWMVDTHSHAKASDWRI